MSTKDTGKNMSTDIQQSEERIQYECYKWATDTYPQLLGYLFHVSNGGYRNKQEAAKFASIGVIGGIPDLLCVWKGKLVGIEMKTEKGVLSKSQELIHAKWRAQGIEVVICRTLEQFKEVIEYILK